MELILKNRYKVLRAIASGGFGETFLAQDTQMPSKRLCLIKQLRPIDDNPQVHTLVKERFEREAAIIEKLGNDNGQIPKLYAYFEENEQFYLVEEYIEGETLSHRVRNRGVFEETQVKEILMASLTVLNYVHGQRIIHRDIKPDNIILRHPDDVPILIDFGAVKETMGTMFSPSGHSLNSIMIGTPGFMPSEQAIGRPVYSSDLYALGLTAIYLLTGKMPELLETDPMTGKILWRKEAPNTSLALASVLDKAIQPSASERYRIATEMLSDLERETPITPTMVSPPSPTMIQSPTPTPLISPQRTLPEWLKATITGGIIGAFVLGGLLLNNYLSNRSNTEPIAESSPSPTTATNPETQGLGNNDFPKAVCGDQVIANSYYQVIVTGSENLNSVKERFCQDAFLREGNIQVAAFNESDRARQLQQELTKYFSGVQVNEVSIAPSPIPEPVDSTPQNTSNHSITQGEAENLIDNWLQAKRKIFGSSHDISLGEQLLTGKAYHDNIRRSDGKESSSEWLVDNGAYYEYGVQRIDSVENFTTNSDQATIDVIVTEERTLYNRDGTIDSNQSGFTTKLVRYNLQAENDQWKISNYKTTKTLVRR